MASPSNISELKDLIVANLDVIEFLDLLGLELADLVELNEMTELIEDNRVLLENAVK